MVEDSPLQLPLLRTILRTFARLGCFALLGALEIMLGYSLAGASGTGQALTLAFGIVVALLAAGLFL